jgi:hypothetical protein
MTLQEIKDKLSDLCPGIEFKEVIDRDWATVYATVDSIQFRESTSTKDYSGPDEPMMYSYERLYGSIREYKKDPEGKGRRFRRAFMNKWMENVANGVGDANGETIPSTKQVLDELNKTPKP